MKILTKAQIILLHEHLIKETGGSYGLRDEGLLESALAAPFQEFASFSPYPTLQQKAARLGYSLVKNHPFIDGNKRIGAHAMLTLLSLNGIEIMCSQKELSSVILDVAAGKIGYDGLLQWLLDHQE
ncbi:MAG: type II toxin-antitoxin system death-on-curing family toxin [Clostridia bacterium]|nr:type II toxin-antitoxin system death-on-curing family toxin [Clostridia bacterium]